MRYAGPPRDPPAVTHIKRIYALCQEFKHAKGKVPGNLEEVKTWAIEVGKAKDKDFLSERDAQPYAVYPIPAPLNLVVVHETTAGADGKRLVVNVGGHAVEVDDAGLKRELGRVKPIEMPKMPGR